MIRLALFYILQISLRSSLIEDRQLILISATADNMLQYIALIETSEKPALYNV